MITVRDIISALEEFAPMHLQEPYDNGGLQLGRPDWEVRTVLLTLDVTPAVLEEAARMASPLIVAHHPLIFHGLKKVTESNEVEKMVAYALRNQIPVYAAHTNLDRAYGGVSWKLASRFALSDVQPLDAAENTLTKLVVYVPVHHLEEVRNALFRAGCGHIGHYDQCSFHTSGTGTFRAGEGTQPFAGAQGVFHQEPEVRVETVFPHFLEDRVIASLKEAHPYEEPAFDLYPIRNRHGLQGIGVVGNLPAPADEMEFLRQVREVCGIPYVRHSPFRLKPVVRVALCGGSGQSLIPLAVRAGADVFVSADFKYHDFSGREDGMMLVDAGHYETEQFTKEIFYEVLTKKFPNFAVCFSQVNTNPVNYC